MRLDVLQRGPCVVGATGGSGTRVIARILRDAGLYIGQKLNVSEDPLDFGEFSDRWIDRAFGYPARAFDDGVPAEMDDHLVRIVEAHLGGWDTVSPWGWKEPRSIYLLPYYRARFPALRFLHFVRDGRDMAFSANQNQLRRHGEVLVERSMDAPECQRSLLLWSRINTLAADYGERELGAAYRRIRFEDLCFDPEAVIENVLEFFSLNGQPAALARHVSAPETIGRWRSAAEPLRPDGETAAALRRFGYLDAESSSSRNGDRDSIGIR